MYIYIYVCIYIYTCVSPTSRACPFSNSCLPAVVLMMNAGMNNANAKATTTIHKAM